MDSPTESNRNPTFPGEACILDRHREFEGDVRDQLKLEGILNAGGISYFVSMQNRTIKRPPPLLERKSGIDLDKKMLSVERKHQKILRERCESAKRNANKISKAKERRERDTDMKRLKVERKHRRVEEREKERAKYVRKLKKYQKRIKSMDEKDKLNGSKVDNEEYSTKDTDASEKQQSNFE